MIKIYITILFTSICTIVFGQETLQTVTDRGNTTTNSLQIGGASVNANTTKLFINNPYGNNWALSSGANMISENGFHIYNWSASSNAPYFSIINGGNVGIGTVSPDSKLHVYSPGGTVFKALGGSAYLIVDNVGSGENYYSANAGHYFQVAGVNKMILNSAGNLSVNGVGIDGIKLWSTSHPNDYYLSNTWDGTYWQLKSNHPSAVNVGHADAAAYSSNSGGLGGNTWGGTVLSTAPSTLIGIDPTTGIYQYNATSLKNMMGLGDLAYQNKVTSFNSYNNQGYYLIHEWDGTGWNLRSENDHNDGQNNVHLVNINGKAANALKWGGQEFIGSNGSVGAIMTNQAGTNLYGYSSISQVKSALATSLQDITAAGNTTTNNIVSTQKITGSTLIALRNDGNTAYTELNNGVGKWWLGTGVNAGSDALFGIYDVNAGINRFVINPTGNIGVGTTAPDEKLTVNGKIKANEIRVNGAGAPDYVFEDGYKVATLETLEGYIKANKHLPEVPSAKEFERDGMAIGEMNKLLLKKIEELTLHVIEMNKRVEKLETENRKLKSNGN
jgi:hypothetical protein